MHMTSYIVLNNTFYFCLIFKTLRKYIKYVVYEQQIYICSVGKETPMFKLLSQTTEVFLSFIIYSLDI